MLKQCGLDVTVLPPIEELPDSTFVEDAALILEECVVLTRPGKLSRRPEVPELAPRLAAFRNETFRIQPPGTLDGGDVLCVGKKLFIGISTRTNVAGAEQLAQLARRFGYQPAMVEVNGCLHLKTACTALSDGSVLLNRNWIDAAPFAAIEMIDVDSQEPFAANVMRIDGLLVANAEYPRTMERIERHLIGSHQSLLSVDISELGKAEAGLTCMSLLI
jgi:dimethylargininase